MSTTSEPTTATVPTEQELRAFAGSKRFHLRPIDEHDFQVREIGKFKDRIGRPIEATHIAVAAEGNFFVHRPANPLDNVSLNLILHSIRVYHKSAVVRAHDVLHGHLAGSLVNLHFGNDRDIGVGALG